MVYGNIVDLPFGACCQYTATWFSTTYINSSIMDCFALEVEEAWWAAVHEVAKSRTQLNDFSFTFHFHALEKEMATHSSVLAWRIPGMGEPGRRPSMGSHRVGHDWSDLATAAAAAEVLAEFQANFPVVHIRYLQYLWDTDFCVNVELVRKEIILVDYPLQIQLFAYMLVSASYFIRDISFFLNSFVFWFSESLFVLLTTSSVFLF